MKNQEGGRVLLPGILLPQITRQGTVCLSSIRGQAQKARMYKFELHEGFQPYHSPLRPMKNRYVARAAEGVAELQRMSILADS